MSQSSSSDPLDLNALLQEIQQEQKETPPDFKSGFVAVVGRPNVGKSTLMNGLIGQKVAIVSPKAQTTRRQILGILTIEEAQLLFVDTPGIHNPHHKLGKYMNEHALSAIPDADVALFVVEANTKPKPMDHEIAEKIISFKGARILVINKIDLVPQEEANQRLAEYQALAQWDKVLLISALEELGLEGVRDAIISVLPYGPLYYPETDVTDQSERLVAAELIREAALHYLDQEVPHSMNIEVNEWKVRSNGMVYIDAAIYVERRTQKGIVIGAKGRMLKRISRDARLEIEEQLGQRVYLELWVKVRDKWRNDETWLNRWGFKPE